jgi:CheY-like chemotaxis protein
MNAIIGMVAIAEASNDIEKKEYALRKIKEASGHLLGIINDILDISKIEANKLDLSPVSFNFEKMLQKNVNHINFKADEKRQKFYVKVDRDIPFALIGDDQRLSQVVTNLLSNAVKFTPEEGIITLDSKLIGEEGDTLIVQISVTDTGIGVTEEQKTRLFKSFEQASTDTSRQFGGTGLGLSICKRIVDMMGGEIWVESETGKGSVFAFTVRLKRDTEKLTRMLPEGVKWSNVRIFAVDDDQIIRDFFMEISADLGIVCKVAGNAEEVVDILDREEPFNIFFIDWKLPGMGGTQLTQRIREQSQDKPIVIIFSEADWSDIEEEAFFAGVSKFLPKPLFESNVVDVINECIGLDNIVERCKEQEKTSDVYEGTYILLVEDVEINREIVTVLLEPSLAVIECAEDGEEAVRMFGENPEKYSIILMDVQMPNMDGYEATRRIRAHEHPKGQGIPIVAMTANVFKEDVEKCLAAGMNDHVGKPLNIDQVYDKMRLYIH